MKTYEDPNSRIVLGPNEPIFLRRSSAFWNAETPLSKVLSLLFLEKDHFKTFVEIKFEVVCEERTVSKWFFR